MGVFFLFLVLIWCDSHPIGLIVLWSRKPNMFHSAPPFSLIYFLFSFSLYCCGGIRWCQNLSGCRHHQSQVQFIWLSHLEETHNILTMEVVEGLRDGERKHVHGCDLCATNRQWFIYLDAQFQRDLGVTKVLQDTFSGFTAWFHILQQTTTFSWHILSV